MFSNDFFAIEEVAKKQQEKQEESAAAAKIQARYRGKKAGKDMRLHLRVLLLLFPCRFWVLHGVPQFNVIKLMPQPPRKWCITPGKFGRKIWRCLLEVQFQLEDVISGFVTIETLWVASQLMASKIPWAPCQEVQEMREQKGAATAIQARYRQRAAQREVDARRKEKQERMAAADGSGPW
jgi:hypothetical protein